MFSSFCHGGGLYFRILEREVIRPSKVIKWVWLKQLGVEALADFFRLKAPLPKPF